MLAATTPPLFEGEDEVGFNRLAKAVRMRRFGGDFTPIACSRWGRSILWRKPNSSHSISCRFIPIVEKAGGVVRNWDGRSAREAGRCIACGDAALLDAALALLAT